MDMKLPCTHLNSGVEGASRFLEGIWEELRDHEKPRMSMSLININLNIDIIAILVIRDSLDLLTLWIFIFGQIYQKYVIFESLIISVCLIK